VGWSWIIPKNFFENVLCIGMHPSDLPLYRGGSPLQHQILDGLRDSMASLFTITEELDAGPIWIKEPFSLRGNNMREILQALSLSSQRALLRFLDAYPAIASLPNTVTEPVLKRRKPEQSRLDPRDFQNKSAKELYNFIRGLTDPYPNAYLQDPAGNKLFFKEVRFEPVDDS
jgi:methionyl-tRNA formyltransferase